MDLPVREVRRATTRGRIVTLDLLGRPFPFVAGQAVELGTTDQPIRKPYSIACSPAQAVRSGVLEFLVRYDDDRGVSPHLLDVAPGREIAVSGPVGDFTWPSTPREAHVLFVAGGTGIAPLRSMIWQALGEGYRGRVVLVHSAGHEADLAWAGELAALAQGGRITLRTFVTRGSTRVPGRWLGRIDRDRLAELVTSRETLCFLCGPASLLDEVPAMLRDLGVVGDLIRVASWRDVPRLTAGQ